jgi:hypothetical protein
MSRDLLGCYVGVTNDCFNVQNIDITPRSIPKFLNALGKHATCEALIAISLGNCVAYLDMKHMLRWAYWLAKNYDGFHGSTFYQRECHSRRSTKRFVVRVLQQLRI